MEAQASPCHGTYLNNASTTMPRALMDLEGTTK